MTRSLLFPFTQGSSLGYLLKTHVLLNPVFVLKVPISARILHVCSFIKCYSSEVVSEGTANLLPLYSSLPRIETTSLALSRLVPWGLKHLHTDTEERKRSPWGRLVSTSVTPRTLGPLRWSGPGRSTCWFSWWDGAARRACRRVDRRGPDSRRRRWAPGRSRTCSCGRCPGRAPPTAGSPSGRVGHRQETGCGGRSKTEASCTQMSASGKQQNIMKKLQVIKYVTNLKENSAVKNFFFFNFF